jgi:hypothetical protein
MRGRPVDPSPAAIVDSAAPSAQRAPDSIGSAKGVRTLRRPVGTFDVVVTFESLDGRAEPVERRSRIEGDVDEVCRRAVLRALPAVRLFAWWSVVVVLTRVSANPESST